MSIVAMHFDVVSLFPDMLQALEYGIVGRALRRSLISLRTWNPRDYSQDSTRRVDDRPFGGGPGMVMQYEPLHRAILAAKSAQTIPVVLLSPSGIPLTQTIIKSLLQHPRLVLVAGRYEGIDERLIQQDVDCCYSIGDYVLSGGELPMMVLIDGLTRLLPGALGDPESVACESFSEGLLDYPQYTRPACVNGMEVPAVLRTGDHLAIRRWRRQQSLGRTWQKRPDLVKRMVIAEEDRALLDHYFATQETN